jgi:CxxC motif-containing protein (DUF1111 family)
MRRHILCGLALVACNGEDGHGEIAEGIMAPMGEPLPLATAEQRATFERGMQVMQHRFSREEGLGPGFNVTFCGSCHEKPVFGGSAGMYRNFFLGGGLNANGAFVTPGGADPLSPAGVVRLYGYPLLDDVDEDDLACRVSPLSDSDDVSPQPYVELTGRPQVAENMTIIAQRNPIPFFGVGLLAEIPEEVILANEDPDDEDGDGISGRHNEAEGFVGRFGVKSQTTSIERFIRGPLFNHLGITTDPLTDEERARLPVDSSAGTVDGETAALLSDLSWFAQADSPLGPNADSDGVCDPEMTTGELFDLVSMSMLLAAPQFEELTEQGIRGRDAFDEAQCGACHVPRLKGPKGPIPAYSDLLLHDMGPDLADGLEQGLAEGSEFRTQPLWGVAAGAPYLHDGRAGTLVEAIEMHGGEATRSRNLFVSFEDDKRADLIEFLMSLGGRDQYSPGLLPPATPLAAVGEWGGPVEGLSPEALARFEEGRALFDREFFAGDGMGGPRFNGDSCRACHFEPVLGGSGPRGVNVVRHGILNDDGGFVPPTLGTILHRSTVLRDSANLPQVATDVYELRQTPHLFGLGLLESVPEAAILANADPDDVDGDGISGKPSYVDGMLLSRFGWKAQVPTIDEFIRDAVTAELGMTLPQVEGLTFGRVHDNDDVPDPEFSLANAELLADYLKLLGPPPRQPVTDEAAAALGETLFTAVGCADCHVPELPGADGPVRAYSDLLLHEILPEDATGIEEASATVREFRTPPLWGVGATGPWLHNGRADSLADAILAHAGEGTAAREAFAALSLSEQDALLTFLESL